MSVVARSSCCVNSHHSSGLCGFLSRAFSRIALALVSCPTLSSRWDSSNHSATEWGHFFNYRNKHDNSNSFQISCILSFTLYYLDPFHVCLNKNRYSPNTHPLVVGLSGLVHIFTLLFNLASHHPKFWEVLIVFQGLSAQLLSSFYVPQHPLQLH